MSDLFFEIMQLQPNENEFLDAVRDSNSKETAYKLGFMHGRSYAAQLADSHREVKNHENLTKALRMLLIAPDHPKAQRKARTLLASLEAEKGVSCECSQEQS